MAEGGDLIKYLGEYEQIISEINTLGGGLSENQIAWGALLPLPASWKACVNQIANEQRAQMTYQNVRQDLLMEVEINKAYDSTSSSKTEDTAKALATQRERKRHAVATTAASRDTLSKIVEN